MGVEGAPALGDPSPLPRWGHPRSQGSHVEWGHPSSACTHPQGPAGVLFFQQKVSALGRGWRGGPRSCWPLAKGKGLLVALPPFVRASHPPSAPHSAGRVGEALERVRKPSPSPRRRYMPPSVHPRVSPCPFPAG